MAKYSPCLTSECFFTRTPAQYCHIHHVFYGPNRKLSEKYGLKVYLRPEYHTGTTSGVHHNSANDLLVKQYAQRKFNEMYPDENFVEIFGKNYM